MSLIFVLNMRRVVNQIAVPKKGRFLFRAPGGPILVCMNRKRFRTAFFLVLLALHVLTPAAAQDWIPTTRAYALPEELFRLHVGDLEPATLLDATWSDFDAVPGEVLDRVSVYWLRYTIPEPGEYDDGGGRIENPAIVVESYATPVRVYLDGVLLSATGAREAPNNRLVYSIYDDSQITPGTELFFRIESNPYAGEEIYLVDRADLAGGTARFSLLYLYTELPTVLFAAFALFVGLVTILIAIVRLGRGEQFLLWFGLFALVYGAYTIFEGNVINVLASINPAIDFYVPVLALDVMPLLLLLFYLSFSSRSWNGLFVALAIGQVLVLSLRLAVMITGLYSEWADQVSLFYPVILLAVVILNLLARQRGNPYAPFFGLAFLVLVATYGLQLAAELYGILGDLPIMVGPMAFFVILGIVPLYSYFRRQAHIAAQNVAFARFVPREFLSILNRTEVTDVALGDQVEQTVTVLFSDIRSYTQISETMTPEQNFAFLNRYLAEMGPIIREHRGFVDKYIGDAIMAIFPGDPSDAVRCAIAMQRRIRYLNDQVRQRIGPPIRVGIGIHTGKTMLGIVGEAERRQGTVISDAVNLASRLEGLTIKLKAGILLSAVTAASVPDGISLRPMGVARIRGKTAPIRVYGGSVGGELHHHRVVVRGPHAAGPAADHASAA